MDADRPRREVPASNATTPNAPAPNATTPVVPPKRAETRAPMRPADYVRPPRAEPAVPPVEAPVRGETVLLVDDDPVARLLTITALAERGWRVLEAESGQQALDRFRRELAAVVVLDAMMPGLDGFATCERLRRQEGGEHVPVLMLTGLNDELSIARAYEAGATDFFVKSTGQWTLLSERLRYLLRASRMREELAQSQAKLTKAQRIARLGSWEWDRAARWVKLSEECCAIAGMQRQEEGVADWFLWSRVHEDERTRIEALYREVIAEGRSLDFECRIQRPDGEARVVHVEAEVDRDESGRATGLHGVVQDVTERKQTEDRIRQLANYDSLTGLPNRRYFRDQFEASLARARERGESVAVLFIDLDRFKQVNDTLGHQVGDQILREVARRLTQTVRESDTVARAAHDAAAAAGPDALPPRLASPSRALAGGGRAQSTGWAANSVARLGGDEFTILLTDLADPLIVERVASRLLEALRVPVQVGEHEVFASGSIGAAVFPHDGEDVDTLIRKADIAMYAVKDDGRNGWRAFDAAMNTATADRWRVESALHRALERNELVLEYQPKINVATGDIIGAEALMRWNREGRLVPPSEFIAVAEETGLIVPITEWAINTVCDQLRAWREVNAQVVPISVNISSRHIQRANLVQPIHEALTRTGVAPALLELELTETVLMHNLGAALPLLQALKQLGVSLSIDDFGTGYSSLSYLKRLPIDILKIDRSFVRDLESANGGQGGDGAAIVAAIIAMSKSLKLRVVAEGVETRGQMQRLFEQGCQLMQGWLFAKSLPHEQFLRLLVDRRNDPAWRVEFAPPARPGAPDAAPAHSNGTHFGAVQATRAETAPPAAPQPSASDENLSPRERAKRWAHRFVGRNA
jgi:PAS domain S-box-containing protein